MAALPPMARAAAPRGFKDRLAVRAVQLGFLAAILLLWYLMTANGAINPLLLPPLPLLSPSPLPAVLVPVLASAEGGGSGAGVGVVVRLMPQRSRRVLVSGFRYSAG